MIMVEYRTLSLYKLLLISLKQVENCCFFQGTVEEIFHLFALTCLEVHTALKQQPSVMLPSWVRHLPIIFSSFWGRWEELIYFLNCITTFDLCSNTWDADRHLRSKYNHWGIWIIIILNSSPVRPRSRASGSVGNKFVTFVHRCT